MPGEQMTLRRESALPASAPYVGVDQLLYNEADGGLYVRLPDGNVRRVNVPPSDARVTPGDARGADAIDFQYTRDLAQQVASGTRSGIIGGRRNGAQGVDSLVLAGDQNIAYREHALVGGRDSMAGGKNSFAYGYGAVAGVYYTFTDYDNTTFVLSGFDTVWSGIPAATTFDVLDFPVGSVCLITTDGVARAGVVASTDGGAKTVTLVANPVGMGNVSGDFVQLSGPGKVANENQLCFGVGNAASGGQSFAAAGFFSLAEGQYAVVLGTENARAKGRASVVLASYGGDAQGDFSCIVGRDGVVTGGDGFKQGYRGEVGGRAGLAMGYYPKSRLWGQRAFSSGVINGVLGRGQHTELELVLQTVDATPTVVQIAENQGGFVFEDDTIYFVNGYAMAVNLGAAEYAAYTFKGLFRRGTGAGSVVAVGAGTVQVEHEDVAAWAFAMAADPSGGGVKFTCTGEAGKNVDWLVHVEAGELATS